MVGRLERALSSAFNPFHNWTHVFVPYLSGDVYVGVDRTRNLQGLYFSGHNLLEATVSKLLNETGLGSARRVLLSGASAGGIGTMENADWLGAKLRAHHTNPSELNFRAHPQAGAFFVNSDVVMFPEFATLHSTWNFASFAASYLYLWFKQLGPPPFLDQSCMAAHADAPHQCWSAAVHYAYIETPLFVGQNKFDSNQAGAVFGHDWWPLPLLHHQSSQAAYVRYFGNRTLEGIAADVLSHGATKTPADGLFMPSCWKHTGNLCMTSSSSQVQGWRMATSLADWFDDGNAAPHQLIDNCAGDDPCNAHCQC